MYEVPYADTILCFDLPTEVSVDVLPGLPHQAPVQDIEQRLHAFAKQVLADSSADYPIIIVFTDATRASPDGILAEPLVRVFSAAGRDIRFLCAVGMHRSSTPSEKLAKLGEKLVGQYPVVDHDPKTVQEIGRIDGLPVTINPMLLNATVVALGVVEPHQYAGYSGGYKTTVIGCGGAATIAETHGPRFLNKVGTRLANTDENPFQSFVRKAGAMIGQDYAVNVITDSEGQIVAMAAGRPAEVHDQLIAFGSQYFEIPVAGAPYDVVIAGVGAPKDANLYQASRAATYIGLSAKPVIRKGGGIIVPAALQEGAGQGQGEKNMQALLQAYGPSPTLLEHLLQVGCRPGEQRAFMLAQLMQSYRLVMVGAQEPAVLDAAHIDHAPDIATAIAALGKGVKRGLIVPHAIQQIPVPTNSIEKQTGSM